MPKMKTHKGAAKRFKLTGSGKVKRTHANRNHFFRNKTQDQKRKSRQSGLVSPADTKRIKKLINE
ncbi:50S ribosomal protein L35 [Tuberibacillus calidus]|jgi:large subunit ribosomal protein L35|uniref:50S ribosomal protein L35 n=1 Tax=Tuberibacillus calidus TaxID=340097 RepID=UPI000413FFBD|nr:50S ribosomal protein L35 [Tuberibacillus calidus]